MDTPGLEQVLAPAFLERFDALVASLAYRATARA